MVIDQREKELTNEIAELLRKEEYLSFEREVDIGGIRANFFVTTRNNRKYIIDVKTWDTFSGFRNRAAHQAGLLKETLRVDEVFVVVDNLQKSSISEGVVTLASLIPAINEAISKEKSPRKRSKKIVDTSEKHIFAAMPFAEKYDDVYYVAMSYAAERVDSVCLRVDQIEYSGNIVAEIQKLIRSSMAVIVDLSESLPNVLYEAGYAHALKKPTIHITSTPLEQLPFDVAQWNTLSYEQGQTYKFRRPLAKRLQESI